AARSLSGLIDRLGLLGLEHIENFDACYQLYRRGTRREQNRFKAQFSTPIQIEAIAVWDTVGSLGIPLGSFKQL
ncbi:MAG: phospholipase effector Tle1 domain-containing protein, partial [Marinobacterium sp.]